VLPVNLKCGQKTDYSKVTAASWPVYRTIGPVNYVFDINVTGLGYLESDLFRAEAIEYFKENFVELFGR
jgi:hypothetical protein